MELISGPFQYREARKAFQDKSCFYRPKRRDWSLISEPRSHRPSLKTKTPRETAKLNAGKPEFFKMSLAVCGKESTSKPVVLH